MVIREYADYDQIPNFALETLNWAVSAGISTALTAAPQTKRHRHEAQAAVILMRLCKKYVSW